MARMTRKESHALTRERLVETAKRLFMADGYNVTPLEKVATEAGFSKGAVYSNFATKHELGLAVIDVVLITAIATLGAFLYNMSASLLGGVEVTLAEDK